MYQHTDHDDSSTGLIARVIWRLARQSVAVAVFAVAGSLLVIAAAAVCLRPEAFAAGPARVGWGLLAFVGTVAAGTVPIVAFFGAYLGSSRLSVRGESMTLSTLGLGPMTVWRVLWPLWTLFVLVALLFAFVLEPPSWRAIHQLKGSPQAAAVAWTRVRAGEMRVLPDGGGLSLRDGVLRFTSGDGEWSGSSSEPSPRMGSDGGSWHFGPTRIARRDGSTWQARSLSLRPDRAALERYLEPPRSPWARGSIALLELSCGDGREAECVRAALVLNRRITWAVLSPMMALLGWLLAWTPVRRGRGRAGASWALALPPLALYSSLKLGEMGLAWGLLSGASAAWFPVSVAAVMVLWARRRSEVLGP